jgi:hypothetical protein
VAHAQGEYARAEALTEESLAMFRNLGARWNTACALDTLSNIARMQGAHARSAALGAESLALFRSLDDAKGIARAVATSARRALEQGEEIEAERLCRECLAVYQEIGPMVGAVVCLECLAETWCAPGVADEPGRIERAARLFAAAAAYRDALGISLPAADRAAREQGIARARECLGEQDFMAAWATGAALSLARAIGAALEPESGPAP